MQNNPLNPTMHVCMSIKGQIWLDYCARLLVAFADLNACVHAVKLYQRFSIYNQLRQLRQFLHFTRERTIYYINTHLRIQE